jgi:hypothetical protein
MTKAAALNAVVSHSWTVDGHRAVKEATTRTAFLNALLQNPHYARNSGEVQRIMALYDAP